METRWVLNSGEYVIDPDNLSKEDLIKGIMEFWDCTQQSAEDFLRYSTLKCKEAKK